jgi:hypothetical protein
LRIWGMELGGFKWAIQSYAARWVTLKFCSGKEPTGGYPSALQIQTDPLPYAARRYDSPKPGDPVGQPVRGGEAPRVAF